MKDLKIIDITLRCCYGREINLAFAERIGLLKSLIGIGIKEIEIAAPGLSKKEREQAREILKMKLEAEFRSWNRPLILDLRESAEAGFENVLISLTPDLKQKVQVDLKANFQRPAELMELESRFLNNLKSVLNYAAARDLKVKLEICRASAVNLEYLLKLIKFCQQFGVSEFAYQEEEAVISPLIFTERIEKIIKNTGIELELNCSNHLSTATASALAAVEGGVRTIAAAVNSLADHSYGSLDLAEIVMALERLKKLDLNLETENLFQIYSQVAELFKQKIAFNKAVVGSGVFKHESGIHADGVLKNPETYEPYPPELVGQEREIVIGKHSGRNALKAKYRELGVELSEELLGFKLKKIRKKAVGFKRALTDQEILDI
ncbi:MAG: hypothetical protein ABR547_01485 [Halanaerobium sp.]